MGNKVSLEEELINMRIVSKQMIRSSKKCEKNEKAAKDKLKKAIQQGNTEGARIYAQDAIREKNQAISHLRMASRIDACSSRIETAVRMNQVTASMKGVVRGMDKSLAAMDINQISQLMDKFEQQFEDLDVKTQYMEGSMNATTSSSTPAEQVDELIQITADQNNLQLGDAFTQAGPIAKKTPALVVPSAKHDNPVADSLEARLANLRN